MHSEALTELLLGQEEGLESQTNQTEKLTALAVDQQHAFKSLQAKVNTLVYALSEEQDVVRSRKAPRGSAKKGFAVIDDGGVSGGDDSTGTDHAQVHSGKVDVVRSHRILTESPASSSSDDPIKPFWAVLGLISFATMTIGLVTKAGSINRVQTALAEAGEETPAGTPALIPANFLQTNDNAHSHLLE